MVKKVTDLRFERKFLIKHIDKEEIEHRILNNRYLFYEIFYERTVNNIYFDDANFSFYHENVSGIADRKKYRIRWYGSKNTPLEKAKLEIKIKHGFLGEKKTVSLPSFKPTNTINLYAFKELKSDVNSPFLNATLINRYKRKYFLSADKKFRITLDTNLSYSRPNIHTNPAELSYDDHEHIVMEVKYNFQHDKEAYCLLQDFPYRMTKNSKYVTGLERLI